MEQKGSLIMENGKNYHQVLIKVNVRAIRRSTLTPVKRTTSHENGKVIIVQPFWYTTEGRILNGFVEAGASIFKGYFLFERKRGFAGTVYDIPKGEKISRVMLGSSNEGAREVIMNAVEEYNGGLA